MAVYLGVDPGAQGCLCFLDRSKNIILFLDTPGVGFSPSELRQGILEIHQSDPIQMIGIEDVHAIHGTSSGSNFQFGYNVGLLHGILRTTGIGLDLVTPKVWQKSAGVPSIGLTGKAHKRSIAETAIRLYPQANLFGPKGGLLDGKADSLLIAHHLAIKYGSKS